MNKKIFFIIFFLVISTGLLFWAYRIQKNRSVKDALEDNSLNITEETNKLIKPADNIQEQEETATADNNNDNNDNNKEKIIRKTNYNIKKEDCENECARFKVEEALKHCQEVCGLIPVAKVEGDNACVGMEGVTKDYCLRDKAVTTKDFSVCELIVDKNIYQQCKNRVIEDIMDGSSMK